MPSLQKKICIPNGTTWYAWLQKINLKNLVHIFFDLLNANKVTGYMLPSTFKCRKCFETSVHDSGCSHRLLVWKLMHLSNINVSVSIVFSTLVEPMTRLVSRPCDVRRVAISSPQKGYGLRGSRKSAGTVREKEDATDMAANEQGGRERRRWGLDRKSVV